LVSRRTGSIELLQALTRQEGLDINFLLLGVIVVVEAEMRLAIPFVVGLDKSPLLFSLNVDLGLVVELGR